MNNNIRFSWNNKNYEVSMKAYSTSRILLPDGTLLEVKAWMESMPPQPDNLLELQTYILRSSAQAHEIAETTCSVLATEIITREMTGEEFVQMIADHEGITLDCLHIDEKGEECKYSERSGGDTIFLNKELILQLLAPGNVKEVVVNCNYCSTPQKLVIAV